MKDKFLFGLLHVCMTDQERAIRDYGRYEQPVFTPQSIMEDAYSTCALREFTC